MGPSQRDSRGELNVMEMSVMASSRDFWKMSFAFAIDSSYLEEASGGRR